MRALPTAVDTLRAAIAHHRNGEIGTAISLYSEIVAEHPDHIEALHLLGRAHLKRRQIDDAADCFQRILAREPANRRALESFGDVLQRRCEFAAARSAYEACLSGGGSDHRVRAKIASIAYADEHLRACPGFAYRSDLLAYALAEAPGQGLTIELGVADGASLRLLASRTAGPVYGFDSFAGLPEDWQPGFPAGSFARERPPSDLPENARLVIGMFADTLPAFAAARPEPIRFLHADCDLYTSMKTAFDAFGGRLVADSVIVFDEFFNYPGWRDHEYRAFCEFVEAAARPFSFLAWIPGGTQVAVKLG